MEGNIQCGKRVLEVRRGYERSRLETAQLAAAYERVLPEVQVVLSESRCRTKISTAAPIVFASELVGMQSKHFAMGGHLS